MLPSIMPMTTNLWDIEKQKMLWSRNCLTHACEHAVICRHQLPCVKGSMVYLLMQPRPSQRFLPLVLFCPDRPPGLLPMAIFPAHISPFSVALTLLLPSACASSCNGRRLVPCSFDGTARVFQRVEIPASYNCREPSPAYTGVCVHMLGAGAMIMMFAGRG